MTISEIEDKVAANEMSAAQVFTQMRQHALTPAKKTVAKERINVILQSALSGTDETLRLEGQYIRWGLVEERMQSAIDSL